MTRRRLLLPVLLTALLLPQLALAQDDTPTLVTWVSFVQAKPGMGDGLVKLTIDNGGLIYDPLMAAGHVTGWGVALPINHWPDDDFSHVEWVTFAGWAGVEQFVQTFFAAQGAKSPEQHAAEQAAYQAHVVPGSHYDSVHRHLEVTGWGDSPPGYLNLAFYKARPGKEGAAKELYDEYAAPIYAKLQEAGTISGHGVYVPDLHGDPTWSHVVWTGLPDLGARDAMIAAFEAMPADRAAAMAEKAAEIFVPETHQDRILLVVHHGGGQEGEE